MKKSLVLTLILIASVSSFSFAQKISDLYQIYDPISQSTNSEDTTNIYTPFGIIKPGKPVYNVSFGASYSSFGHGMGYSSSTITPTVAYAPSNKFQIFAGASISRDNYSNLSLKNIAPNNGLQQNDGNPTQVFAYGQYQVNNKFSVYAMGSYAKNQLYISPFYGGGIGKADYQQFGVGFNYKLSSRTSISASFNFANGLGYMGVSPNGFNTSPFFP